MFCFGARGDVIKILLTGASGFVGKAVLDKALQRGLNVRSVYRTLDSTRGLVDVVQISTLHGLTEWRHALLGVDVVIHAAGCINVVRENSINLLTEYRRVNVDGTVNLALQAAAAGVKRFVFISSIKVNGETSPVGCPFTASDVPSPSDSYGISKSEAETGLKDVAQQTGMEVTIIRPPLIYGPGVKGNFAALIELVRRGIPLPLADVTDNRRSMVALDNLVDLILLCVDHPQAANQIFLVSDGYDLSTSDLLKKIGYAMGRQVRLFWISYRVINFMAIIFGKKTFSQRLLGTLQVDIQKTTELLDWKPQVSVDDGLRRAVGK